MTTKELELVDQLRRLTDAVRWPEFLSTDEPTVDRQTAADALRYLNEHYPQPRTWRDDPMTEAQQRALFRFNAKTDGLTKGTASELLSSLIEDAKRRRPLPYEPDDFDFGWCQGDFE